MEQKHEIKSILIGCGNRLRRSWWSGVWWCFFFFFFFRDARGVASCLSRRFCLRCRYFIPIQHTNCWWCTYEYVARCVYLVYPKSFFPLLSRAGIDSFHLFWKIYSVGLRVSEYTRCITTGCAVRCLPAANNIRIIRVPGSSLRVLKRVVTWLINCLLLLWEPHFDSPYVRTCIVRITLWTHSHCGSCQHYISETLALAFINSMWWQRMMMRMWPTCFAFFVFVFVSRTHKKNGRATDY